VVDCGRGTTNGAQFVAAAGGVLRVRKEDGGEQLLGKSPSGDRLRARHRRVELVRLCDRERVRERDRDWDIDRGLDLDFERV